MALPAAGAALPVVVARRARIGVASHGRFDGTGHLRKSRETRFAAAMVQL